MSLTIQRSFSDPTGPVFQTNEGYVRPLDDRRASELEALLTQRFFVDGVASGRLPATRLLRRPTIRLVSEAVGPLTYPWEWSPLQLARAGLFTIEMAIAAFDDGYVMKDAQARNVVFRGLQPVFVDVASFEPYRGDKVWMARGQFDRHFLLPLLAFAHRGVSPAGIHRVEPDGLQPAAAKRLLGLRAWSGLIEIETCALPSASRGAGAPAATARAKDQTMAASVFRSILLHTQSLIVRMTRRIEQGQRTDWGDYADGHFHYGESELAQKKAWIRQWLPKLDAKRMVDIGANTGTFSRLAAEFGIESLAIESDAGALNQLLLDTPEAPTVSPLLMDMCMPSMGGGWDAREWASFHERFEGWADLVLGLAVVHHVAVRGYGYPEFIASAARLTRRHALIEFVDPQDEMFSEMLATRGLDASEFQRSAFLDAFEHKFSIVDTLELKGGKRLLVLGACDA